MTDKKEFKIKNSSGVIVKSSSKFMEAYNECVLLPGASLHYVESRLIEDEYEEIINITILNNYAKTQQNNSQV